MLDIKFIRENIEQVKRDTINKGYKNVDVDVVLELDDQRKKIGQQADELRARRNQIVEY